MHASKPQTSHELNRVAGNNGQLVFYFRSCILYQLQAPNLETIILKTAWVICIAKSLETKFRHIMYILGLHLWLSFIMVRDSYALGREVNN